VLPEGELKLIKHFAAVVGFKLPDVGWKGWREPVPAGGFKNDEEGWIQSLIHEGELYTVEDWAEYFFVPLMREKGILWTDEAIRALQMPAAEEQKFRQGMAKKRDGLIKGLTDRLGQVKKDFGDRYEAGLDVTKNALIWGSGHLEDGDHWVWLNRSWRVLGHQHGDFLTEELIGLAYERMVHGLLDAGELARLQLTNVTYTRLLGLVKQFSKEQGGQLEQELRQRIQRVAQGRTGQILGANIINKIQDYLLRVIVKTRGVEP
jgi:hypothetical protein